MFHSTWFMRLGTLGFNLLLLNGLWLIFTVMGLGVFGVFPATAALFAVLRDIIIRQDDQKIINKYLKYYKKDWLLSNLLGHMYSLGLFIMYLNIKVIDLIKTDVLYTVAMTATIIVTLLILLSFLYLFPIYVHLKFNWFEYPKYAFIMAIAKPFNTLLLIALIALVICIYFIIPVLILLLGIGLIGYIVMKIALFSLPKSNESN